MKNCLEFKLFCERRIIKRYKISTLRGESDCFTTDSGFIIIFRNSEAQKTDSQMYMIILNNKTLALRKTLNW